MSKELTEQEKIDRAVAQGGAVFDRIEDALGFTDAEKAEFVLRADLAKGIRTIRRAKNMTQAQLASLIKSKQPTIATLELGLPKVSLDLMFKAFFALGGTIQGLASGKVMPEGIVANGKATSPVSRVRPKPAKAAAPAKGKTAASVAPAKKAASRKTAT